MKPLEEIRKALDEAIKSAGTHRAAALDYKHFTSLNNPLPSDAEWYAVEDRARSALVLLDKLAEGSGEFAVIRKARCGRCGATRDWPDDNE